MNLKTFLTAFAILAVALTVIPYLGTDYWGVRVFDFPHLQLTVLTGAALLAYFLRFDRRSLRDYGLAGLLTACFIFQLAKVAPYTPLNEPQVGHSSFTTGDRTLSVYIANVLQENPHKEKLRAAIDRVQADLLVFTETDRAWRDGIANTVRGQYPHAVEMPLSNTYGMLLYSKFPLIDPTVQFIVDDSIPSIHTRFVLPAGDTIQLYVIHPTPPVPQHNPSSADRDAEMMKIALAAMQSPYPVLVLGDFNDVAWSQSTRHFLQVGGLLDPRKGRGLYNTYHAKYFLLRWPLDHIFVSEHFRVADLRREAPIESDHFPVFTRLSYEPEHALAQKAPPPKAAEIEKAQEQIQAEREADREG